MTAVAGALAYDHRGLLNRDVKPAKIMFADLDDDGDQRVVLTDFGTHATSTTSVDLLPPTWPSAPSRDPRRVCGDRALGGGVRRLLLPFLRWGRGDLAGAGDESDCV
jgi:serine/threonine protein kinase